MFHADQLSGLAPADPLEAGAWTACLKWACTHPEVIDRYRDETGDSYSPKLTAESQGADLAYAERFVVWFNANVWGDFTGDLRPGAEP